MTATLALPVIQCELMAVRLTVKACGRRWAIAHGLVELPAHSSELVTGIKQSPCSICTFGEARSDSTSFTSLKYSKPSAAPCSRCSTPFKRTKPAQKVCQKCRDEEVAAKPKSRAERRAAAREVLTGLAVQTREPRTYDMTGKCECCGCDPCRVVFAIDMQMLDYQLDCMEHAASLLGLDDGDLAQRFAIRPCLTCEVLFRPKAPNQMYCRTKCLKKAERARRNSNRAGNAVLAMSEARTCVGCPIQFVPEHPAQKYCAACRELPYAVRLKALDGSKVRAPSVDERTLVLSLRVTQAEFDEFMQSMLDTECTLQQWLEIVIEQGLARLADGIGFDGPVESVPQSTPERIQWCLDELSRLTRIA